MIFVLLGSKVKNIREVYYGSLIHSQREGKNILNNKQKTERNSPGSQFSKPFVLLEFLFFSLPIEIWTFNWPTVLNEKYRAKSAFRLTSSPFNIYLAYREMYVMDNKIYIEFLLEIKVVKFPERRIFYCVCAILYSPNKWTNYNFFFTLVITSGALL